MRASKQIAVIAMSLLINVTALPALQPAFAQDSASPTTPPTNTTPETKPADGGDFLKDYEKNLPTTAPTTAVGPIVPPVPPVDPALVPAPKGTPHAHEALNQMPKAPPAHTDQKPIVLKGRLEEVSGNGANLPVGLLLGLKAQKGKMDPVTIRPKADPLKGLVASFPQDWAGSWGGNLIVHWLQMDPSYYQWDPLSAKKEAEVLRPKAVGQTTFNFVQQGNVVSVEPAKIVFPPVQSQQTTQMPSNNPLFSMMQQIASQSMTPVVILGDYVGQGVGGNQLNCRVLKNDIKQIKQGVLEQNIVNSDRVREPDGTIRDAISEVVVRFTKLNPSQLYVQAAAIKYTNTGKFLTKELYYGTMTRGVTTFDPTNPMSGFPSGMPGAGSFPGMPTSGSGGMPNMQGLNDLIQQMQKGLGQ